MDIEVEIGQDKIDANGAFPTAHESVNKLVLPTVGRHLFIEVLKRMKFV